MTDCSRALALAFGLGLCAIGCGGAAPPAAGSTPQSRPASGSGANAGVKPPRSPASPKAAAAREPPAACDFRVGESCFASDTEACAAAGCRQGGCIVLESYPAQITCK